MSTKAVFLTAVVDAWENQHVVVMDVPGASMQADMDDIVHVRFYSEMLEIDFEMYSPFVVEDNGVQVLYVELLKAVYGTLKEARLFWEEL